MYMVSININMANIKLVLVARYDMHNISSMWRDPLQPQLFIPIGFYAKQIIKGTCIVYE
jgi:hypothetical protein